MPVRPMHTLLGSICLLACGGSEAPGDRTMTSGVEVVRITSGRYPVTEVRGESPQDVMEEVGRIRGGPSGFGAIRSIALEPDGSVWVLDHAALSLARYAKDGALLAQRGRGGEGPGEYRDPYSIAALADGVLLYDPGTGRVVGYDSTGGTTSSWTVGRVTGSPTMIRWHPAADGPRLNQVFRSADGMSRGFLRFPPTGVGDTLPIIGGQTVVNPGEALPPGLVICQLPGGGFRAFGSPFEGTAPVVPYRGAVVASARREYALYREGAAGDTAAAVVRAVEQVPITDAEWESATAAHDSVRSSPAGATCRGSLVRPTHKPAVLELMTDQDGRLWVERQGPDDGTYWDAWVGDTLLGTVAAPPRVRGVVPSIRGAWLAMVIENEDGAHQVRVYRLPPFGNARH